MKTKLNGHSVTAKPVSQEITHLVFPSSPHQPAYGTEEISLLELLQYIGRVAQKRASLFAIILLAGLLIGALLHVYWPPVYSSSASFHTDLLEQPEMDYLTRNLSESVKQKSWDKLSHQLSLSPQEAAKLLAIEGKGLVVNPAEPDGKIVYRIAVEVGDHEIFRKMGHALLQYFNQHAYVKMRMNDVQQDSEQLLNAIRKEQSKLDRNHESIQDLLEDTEKQGKTVVFSNLSGLHAQKVKFEAKAFELEQSLRIEQAIQLNEDFWQETRPSNKHFWQTIARSVSVAILLGLLATILLEVREAIRTRTA